MPPVARILAVANCKGGCGKTTTAVNLAAEMAARGWRTLLVDLDPQGHSSLALGVRRPGRITAHDLLNGEAARPSQVLRLAAIGVDLLPADPDFRNPSQAPRARAFADALAPLAALYNVVILDTPPALDLTLISALAAAHHALTPTQLTPLAREGVLRFARAFFYASTELNPELGAFAVVPVQVDLRTRVQQVVLARLIGDFGPERLFPMVRCDTALAEAFDHAEPIRTFRPASRGAADYARLTNRVVDEWLVDRREVSPRQSRLAEPQAAVSA
jgi:chromosome partitioning protein